MFEAGRRVRCILAQWFEGARPSPDPPTLGELLAFAPEFEGESEEIAGLRLALRGPR